MDRGTANRSAWVNARSSPSGVGAALWVAVESASQRSTRVTGGTIAWKVVVDFDLCESNAICMGIVPEVFEVRDDNFLYVLQENPPDDLREKCDQAVRQCPKQAISIEES